MAIQIVALAAEAVAADVMAGSWVFGQPTSYTFQRVVGWALGATLFPELLDKIFDAYLEGETLMVRYAGKTAAIVNRADLCAEFPDSLERQLFGYGFVLRCGGQSRKQVKQALKTARKAQLVAA